MLYADQMNLYAYVGNNPLNATDPTGRQTAKVQGGGSIAGVRGQAVRGNIGVVFGRDDRGRASAALFVSRGFGVGVPNTAGASGGVAVCVSCTMSDVEGRSVSAEAGAVGNVSVDVSTIESNIIAAFDGNSNTNFNPDLVEVAVEAGVGNFVGGSYNQTDIIASVTVPNDINVSGTSEGDLALTYTSPADEGARSFSFRDLLNGYRSEERYPTRDPM